ncbi:MAG: metallophosphoesterase family protein [Planctomycetaceae bacterium]|nr:metallophosphoesterase family protein [Planctomycetaceae bacterium]
MRIGIVADIHEEVDSLKRALSLFRREGVDAVVSLGDACDSYRASGNPAQVATLLREAGAVGVWGNHDVGLSYEVSDQLRRLADPAFLEYMSGMQPHLTIENCRFSHVEPWLDAKKIEDLWYFDGWPDTPEKAARSFAAVPERHLFMGHLHCWLAMTQSRRVEWCGEQPLSLANEPRSLVVIAPVFRGWCAIFETTASLLTPLKC